MSRSPATGGLLRAGARALGAGADASDVGAGTLSAGAEAGLLRAFVDALAFSLGLAAAAAAGIIQLLRGGKRRTKMMRDGNATSPRLG